MIDREREDVLLLKKGDESAFERLCRRYWAKVYHYAGLVAVETLTVAQDDYDLMQEFDPRFVPSLYLLDKDGTVLLKGCGDLKTLLRSEEYKTLIK